MDEQMAEIVLKDVEKYFGDNYIIRKLNLEIRHGEFVVLLGPSGCGKTTTLRAIAGLEDIDSGEILIDGKPVQTLQAADRDIAFVFQLFALYPHLTAFENIAFPLRADEREQSNVDQRVREVAKALRIEHLLDKRPSRAVRRRHAARGHRARAGAQAQGVADGRADRRAGRQAARGDAGRAQAHPPENEATTVYVTHDQVEAMAMADKIAIMNDGVLQQVGAPSDVYQHPANLFVAQFIGSPIMNVVNGAVRPGDGHTQVMLGEDDAVLRFPSELYHKMVERKHAEDDLAVGIRPEGVQVARSATDGYVPVEAHIIEPLGPYDIVDLKFGKQLLRARTATGYVDEGRRHGVGTPGRKADPLLQHPHRRIAADQALRWPTSNSTNITKKFRRHTALNDMSLDIADGEFFVLLGPDRRGQDHDAAADRRAGCARTAGSHLDRRQGRGRLERGRARRGARVPVLLPVSALHRAPEPGVSAQIQAPAHSRRTRSPSAWRRRPRRCASSTCSSARPTGSPAARCSGCPSAAPSCASRACS